MAQISSASPARRAAMPELGRNHVAFGEKTGRRPAKSFTFFCSFATLTLSDLVIRGYPSENSSLIRFSRPICAGTALPSRPSVERT
jgi:hypothetical protein